jgi:hypothetical protein
MPCNVLCGVERELYPWAMSAGKCSGLSIRTWTASLAHSLATANHTMAVTGALRRGSRYTVTKTDWRRILP